MTTKVELHPRNDHRDSYDFEALIDAYAPLKAFVKPNKYGVHSINFFNPDAVKALNAALLALYYNIQWWDIPASALTPPIPGRADYIHYAADLVGSKAARCLDIGVGANCIYPIIGRAKYGWDFVGSDISKESLTNAEKIVGKNEVLRGHVDLRLQNESSKIFNGIIRADDKFDITICNPPFHTSAESATKGSLRKLRGLKGGKGVRQDKVTLNFAGQSSELWCEGGERGFIEQMINESKHFASQCGWFSSLVSSEDNLKPLKAALRTIQVKEYRVIDMYQGNKRSRILAWRF
ncbi:MAG: 23S rRNA (adenine(1618)-N(6))-methyltransferase RlmF [Rikenellaceae bacterium]